MHLFCCNNPVQNGSWVDYNSGEGYQCKINITIPVTGYYILYLRSAYAGSSYQGTSDLSVTITPPGATNSLWTEYHEQPFITLGIRCDYTVGEELNYFTCHVSGDTKIFVEDQTQYLGEIIGWNDDYDGTGDFNWGNASRVKLANIPVRSVHVISDAWNTTCNCDVYMNYPNSGRNYYYDNFEADDDIKSAEADGAYNCFAWAGGITNDYVDPVNSIYGESLLNQPDTLLRALHSFDNYLGNVNKSNTIIPRYEGAFVYSRNGATYANADIDLWYRDRNTFSTIMWEYSGGFTHLSVNSEHNNNYQIPPNNHPHGYAWESKAGENIRFFHPRHALFSPGAGEGHYGDIDKYYKWTGQVATYNGIVNYQETSKGCFSMKESVEKGFTKIKTINFSEEEINKLRKYSIRLSNNIKNNFEKKYIAWVKTWKNPELSFNSNIRAYAISKEYNELLEYCRKEGKKILPLIIQKFDSIFEINLIQDLTFSEYNYLMDEVRKNRVNNLYDDNGVFIFLSDLSLWKKYCKKLIKKSDFEGLFMENSNTQKNNKKDIKKFNLQDENSINLPFEYKLEPNYPNPFNPSTTIRFSLPDNGNINFMVYDIRGKEIIKLINNEFKQKGWHTVTWNGIDKKGNFVSSGIYFYKLQMGNIIKTKKMILMY